MASSTAPKGHYAFSQCTTDGYIHLSMTVEQPNGCSLPCNMQLSTANAERMLEGLLDSMKRYRLQLQERMVAIEDTVKDTLRRAEQQRVGSKRVIKAADMPERLVEYMDENQMLPHYGGYVEYTLGTMQRAVIAAELPERVQQFAEIDAFMVSQGAADGETVLIHHE